MAEAELLNLEMSVIGMTYRNKEDDIFKAMSVVTSNEGNIYCNQVF